MCLLKLCRRGLNVGPKGSWSNTLSASSSLLLSLLLYPLYLRAHFGGFQRLPALLLPLRPSPAWVSSLLCRCASAAAAAALAADPLLKNGPCQLRLKSASRCLLALLLPPSSLPLPPLLLPAGAAARLPLLRAVPLSAFLLLLVVAVMNIFFNVLARA